MAPDIQQGFSFSFYPNPATDYLFLDTEATFTDATLVLMDVSGKALLTYCFKDQTELAQAQINLTHLPDGIYYLKLYTKNKSKAQKLIIIR